jgi:hypothetical protein
MYTVPITIAALAFVAATLLGACLSNHIIGVDPA